MMVLHVLETSAPEVVGYTIRGRYIVNHQRQLGFDPLVLTSPFYPRATDQRTDVIDGIRYIRSNHIPRPQKTQGRLVSYWTRMNMLRRYRHFAAEVARRERPAILHAHSSYTNGLAAAYAADTIGVPFVYELRTLWGESAVVEDGWNPNSLRYKAVWNFELGVMRRAHVVVAISRGIRDAIVERGVDASKVMMIPNGVDTAVFTPQPFDAALARELQLEGAFVVGFVGSLRRLEGLGLLVDAFAGVRARVPNARVVVVGDGPDREPLIARARERGLSDVIRFIGAVPHDQVLRYYSIMDVLAYPRIDARINQTVTPLKPLEAMAMGKICIGSDVGGLRELIADEATGLLFAVGDQQDLTDTIVSLATDPAKRSRLAAEALATVRRDREWSTIAARYNEVYAAAGERRRAAGGSRA